MDLSSLKAAEGSAHSDNFRRGRGHGSGNGKTAGKGHKGQKARSGAPRPGYTEDYLREVSSAETLRKSLVLIFPLLRNSITMQSYQLRH